jgi:6-pyruvoyltetrahydropterin/6-carboxytetrahydropterin synthase
MWIIKKTYPFEASHQLPHHDGKCARLHGHSYKVTVVLAGLTLVQDGSKSGMLIDYNDIDTVMEPYIAANLDHHHLNDTLDCESPTAELIAKSVYGYLKTFAVIGNYLSSVEVSETANTWAVYSEGLR